MTKLIVIESHPVQYHAPIYRRLQADYGISVRAIYGSDCSLTGYEDKEFVSRVQWDTDLLSGYDAIFLRGKKGKEFRGARYLKGRSVLKILRESDAQHILLVGYGSLFDKKAIYYALQSGKPLLFRGETTDHARRRFPVYSWFRDLTLREFYRRCARLCYVGERSHDHFIRLGCPEEQLVYSPYCVDPSAFDPEETRREIMREQTRHRLGVGANEIVLLFSGKLTERKNPDLIIRALRHMPEPFIKKVTVLFLGDGSMHGELLSLAKERPRIKVQVAGFQNQTQLSPYYHASDLLILPSKRLETWGLVVNEALHHGVPALVSDAVGCHPDLIEPGRTGYVFKSGSSKHLADALERAQPLVGSLNVRAACRKKVSMFSIENAARGIAEACAAGGLS